MNPIPIADDASLATAARRLATAPRLALDTEFMRERTYYAELALLQLADGDAVTLIDPLAGLEPGRLAALLQVPGQTKVLHAARQDVEVLLPVTGTPLAPILDTQLAAALAGHPPQIGYGELVLRELGQTLEKGQARTDWTRRPLSPAQLAYAADDVLWLLPLAAKLEARLEQLGRLAWLHHDATLLSEPSLYALHPGDAWQRFKGIESLPPAEQARLRALAAWREARAARRNLPRGWVLADDAARAIARAAPAGIAALQSLDVMPAGAIDKLGAEIVAALAEAAAGSTDGLVQRQDARPSAEERERLRRLGDALRRVSTALGLAPEVVATQRDLRRIARGEAVGAVLRGWRLAELGPALDAEVARG